MLQRGCMRTSMLPMHKGKHHLKRCKVHWFSDARHDAVCNWFAVGMRFVCPRSVNFPFVFVQRERALEYVAVVPCNRTPDTQFKTLLLNTLLGSVARHEHPPPPPPALPCPPHLC